MITVRFVFLSGEPENRAAVEAEINSYLEPVHTLIEHIGLANFNGTSFTTPDGWHVSTLRRIFGEGDLAAFVSAPGDRRSITGRLLDEK